MNDNTVPRILICEDDFLIASDMARSFTDLGARVVGFARNATKALELAAADGFEIDAAVLDVNLSGEEVYPAAKALKSRGIPVVFYSGYTRQDLPGEFAADPFVSKPAEPATILQAISRVVRRPLCA